MTMKKRTSAKTWVTITVKGFFLKRHLDGRCIVEGIAGLHENYCIGSRRSLGDEHRSVAGACRIRGISRIYPPDGMNGRTNGVRSVGYLTCTRGRQRTLRVDEGARTITREAHRAPRDQSRRRDY